MALPTTPLHTERLLLRPYEAADAPAFYAVLDASRARLTASFPDRLRLVAAPADVPAQLAAFAHDWHTGRFYVFGIWRRDTGAYIGDICLMPQRQGQAEIGYYLATEAVGYGYAREALGALVDFGFGLARARRLLIRCFVDNERAQAVARAHGFELASPAASWFRFNWWESRGPQATILHFWLSRPE